MQGPEVRQAQGQLSPGSGPVGEHQAEGGVGWGQGRGAHWPQSLLCPIRLFLSLPPSPAWLKRNFPVRTVTDDKNRTVPLFCDSKSKPLMLHTRRLRPGERRHSPNSQLATGGLETQTRCPRSSHRFTFRDHVAGPALGGRRPPGPSSPVRRAVHGLEGEGVRGVAGAVVPLGAGGPVGAWGLQGKHVFLIMLPVP